SEDRRRIGWMRLIVRDQSVPIGRIRPIHGPSGVQFSKTPWKIPGYATLPACQSSITRPLIEDWHAGSVAYRPPVSAHHQGGESPLQAGALRPVAKGNCVVMRRGGEQPAANDQSVG